MKTYQEMIQEDLEDLELEIICHPRHVEAFMRLENGTLDGLPPRRFRSEVYQAALCVEGGGIDMAETLAQSYSL